MLSEYQRHWGVEQWTAYLKAQDMPIMPRSRYLLQAVVATQAETISPRDLVGIVTGDPFLALRLLIRAELRHSRTLGHDITTPLASILQTGLDDLTHIINHSPLCDDSLPGLADAEFRSATASFLGRRWAACRADLSPDEVALAALLADIGEVMLWHFAPEIPMKVAEEIHSGRAQRTIQAQQQAAGFSFKSLSLSLADAWSLPPLLTQLIRGADTVRANIARIATDTARHLQSDMDNPAIPSDILSLHAFLPGASFEALLEPLPISDEYREAVLKALE
ncbi:MAG: HDOD domain-containing protein [Rhodocyclaceae bacterium]|nr:HDOD domain-containing protein [Rhodocyclaceae bacterium]